MLWVFCHNFFKLLLNIVDLQCCVYFFKFWPHPAACGILVPQAGIEPAPLALIERWSLNHSTTREVPKNFWGVLGAQCLETHLPVEEMRVQSLLQEDLTCCGPTKPLCHNY